MKSGQFLTSLFSDFFYLGTVVTCSPKPCSFKTNVRTHMRSLMSSYDNDLLSSTMQNEVPCRLLWGSPLYQEKEKQMGKRKDYAVTIQLLISLPRRSQPYKSKCFALILLWWEAAECLHVPLGINAVWKMENKNLPSKYCFWWIPTARKAQHVR